MASPGPTRGERAAAAADRGARDRSTGTTGLRGALSRFVPPLALMGLIFFLSAQPDLNSGLGTLDTILRKLAHMTEYALLWLLWLRALRWHRPGIAVAIAVAYAISDELHQSGVEGRVGSPRDVLIDTLGVALAWALWSRRERRRPAHRPA